MQKGFTIIELIVVVAIIAVLAAIVAVNVIQYIAKAKDASIIENLNTIATNATVYFLDNGEYLLFDGTDEYIIPAAEIDKNNGDNDIAEIFETDVYCVSSSLVTNQSIRWCIDSTGVNMKSASCNLLLYKCVPD